MLNVTLLGTGGGMPMPNRFLSSVVMNFKGRKILLDCGEGTQVSMRVNGTGFKSIDIICISHLHGDHIYGLPGLLSTIGNSGRTEDIYIIGPKGIKEVIEGFLITLPYLPYKLNILEDASNLEFMVKKEKMELVELNEKISSDLSIKTLELDHSSPCLGYSFNIRRGRKFNVEKALMNKVPKEVWSKLQRNEEVSLNGVKYYSYMVLGDERKGIKLSYTTDTRPTEDIPGFIKESDLYICEGTYGSEEDMHKAIKNKHMTFKEAANLAKRGQVKELLLTHFSPAINDPKEFINNAREVFENSHAGSDGEERILNFKE
ncbi:ribonuclease Z [Clostridium perfringens]|uniref:ribonuclease Z n=1 Tax=Clostridium perfringens TaxID=1502 RepID=UPI0010398D52|nr:ribonuclease Z [Clostridium perfringens]EHK2334458.1 ribonuclease Z [Clostridium perfringens]ELC8412658.1 ribonuclease Z [Clostridium perfringens]TBX08294.1 ribonuclease Z [Clostridium perfringens]